jgi:hypothetical protein
VRGRLDAWFPTALKWTGLVATVAFGVVWLVTALLGDALSPPPALLAAFGTMFGVGMGGEAYRELGKGK